MENKTKQQTTLKAILLCTIPCGTSAGVASSVRPAWAGGWLSVRGCSFSCPAEGMSRNRNGWRARLLSFYFCKNYQKYNCNIILILKVAKLQSWRQMCPWGRTATRVSAKPLCEHKDMRYYYYFFLITTVFLYSGIIGECMPMPDKTHFSKYSPSRTIFKHRQAFVQDKALNLFSL